MMETILWFFLSPLLKWLGLYGIVAVIGLSVWMFAPRTPPWFPIDLNRFREAGLLIGLFAIGLMFISTHFFNAGQDHMAQRIAARDQAAQRRVLRALDTVDLCGAENWDVTTGSCRR